MLLDLDYNYQPEDQYSYTHTAGYDYAVCSCGECAECYMEQIEDLREEYSILLAKFHHSIGERYSEEKLQAKTSLYNRIWDDLDENTPIYDEF